MPASGRDFARRQGDARLDFETVDKFQRPWKNDRSTPQRRCPRYRRCTNQSRAAPLDSANRSPMLSASARWHPVMPLITSVCGYFPGQRLGRLEDTPKDVVWDWVRSTRGFEDRPSAEPAKV